MPNFSTFRLGRKPHDPSRVAAVPSHRVATAGPAPLTLPRNGLTWTPSLVRNDTLPTCVIAGLINSARVWTLLHGFDPVVVEANLLAMFAAIDGCPNTESSIAASGGLVMLDALEYVRVHGVDIGAEAPLMLDFTSIETTDELALRDAIYTRGTALVGVMLYTADMQPGAPWKGRAANAGAPVGGHCLDPWRYPSVTDYGVATWGESVETDDDWLMSRIDEAYALDWLMPIAPPV